MLEMLWMLVVFIAVLFVAYSNGANDNFKGVATLFGSGTSSYNKSLMIGTLSTFAGSLFAVILSTKLMHTFTGKGLVPDAIVGNPSFVLSVAIGAALTVFLAAKIGIPISTTHSLTGALVGSGFVSVGAQLGIETLGKSFVLPLLASPFIAILMTFILYHFFHWGRMLSGVTKETCLCVEDRIVPISDLNMSAKELVSIGTVPQLKAYIDDAKLCNTKIKEQYHGMILGIRAEKILDLFHYFSASAVSFARGLNDTPKVLALLLAAGAFNLRWNILFIAIAIAVGGILGSRKIAETLSHRITEMNHGEAFTGNLVTAILVIFASHIGVPVSTTHVSCGSLFGIGLVNGKAKWKKIGEIFFAWVLTLPVAALISGVSYLLISKLWQ